MIKECWVCRKQFSAGTNARTCSEKCKKEYYVTTHGGNKKPNLTEYKKICLSCGNGFRTFNKDKNFCTDTCEQIGVVEVEEKRSMASENLQEFLSRSNEKYSTRQIAEHIELTKIKRKPLISTDGKRNIEFCWKG